VIRSFKDKETERVFRGQRSRAFPPEIQKSAQRKLIYLDGAGRLGDLTRLPGNRLEALKGGRTGQWSIRINDQWRICFVWENGAEQVEIVDYH
jgi:proteic killer suppression protein